MHVPDAEQTLSRPRPGREPEPFASSSMKPQS